MTNPVPEDFTGLTCTNFMIKLKIYLNKLKPGDSVQLYATREQFQNFPKNFFKAPLRLDSELTEPNKYLLRISKSR